MSCTSSTQCNNVIGLQCINGVCNCTSDKYLASNGSLCGMTLNKYLFTDSIISRYSYYVIP